MANCAESAGNLHQNCIESAETAQTEDDMAEKRVTPGGYICRQRLDEIAMYHSDILRDLEAITSISANREEIYRILARVIHRVHQSNRLLTELKLIYD